jgi:hypothetical protein
MSTPTQKVARFGQTVYPSNPSVPDASDISKRKRVKIGNEHRGVVIDGGTGEIFNPGGAAFYEYEEIDKERFVKLYLAGLKQAVGLSKAGLAVFQLVYDQMRENKGRDHVLLTAIQSGLVQQTFSRGLRELIDRGFLFRSENPTLFWVNVQFMFNGDRLAFVKGYKLKGADPRQSELPLDEPKKLTAGQGGPVMDENCRIT